MAAPSTSYAWSNKNPHKIFTIKVSPRSVGGPRMAEPHIKNLKVAALTKMVSSGLFAPEKLLRQRSVKQNNLSVSSTSLCTAEETSFSVPPLTHVSPPVTFRERIAKRKSSTDSSSTEDSADSPSTHKGKDKVRRL